MQIPPTLQNNNAIYIKKRKNLLKLENSISNGSKAEAVRCLKFFRLKLVEIVLT